MTDLSSRALLTSLTVSQWSARKFDRKETAQLALKHGIGDGVARVNKSLLPASDTLDAVQKKTNAMRWDYYNSSLPWGQDGVNVIRAEGYMDFVTKMRTHMTEWRGLVRAFVDDYPRLRSEARVKLNGLYRDDDYPDASDVERKFHVDVKFFPVPSANDWRVSLADGEIAELEAAVTKQVKQSEGIAMRDVWRRVHELVERSRERLSDPKAVFRDSLVENARELCKILPSLNLTDDPALERIRSEIEGSLCAHTAEVLREAPDVRSEVAAKMADVLAKMSAFYSAD